VGGLGLLIPLAWSGGNNAYETVSQAAAKKVAPSVVKIETQGGTDIVKIGPKGANFRKALGPTTGVVVSADGYIISSAFNFINNPTTILIEVQGEQKPYLAKKVATDHSRMLTLLKVDAKNLLVPEVVAKKDVKVGQTTLALGRTLDSAHDAPPSMSFGIVSALNRIWSKCIQTDAKTSPVNYGGPIIDVQGRVQGIIVPASPKGDDLTAGYDWYDSGIGFAVPMEDVLAVLPRLKKGQDLKPGILGVKFQSQDAIGGNLVLGTVEPDSAAAKAGLQPGDKITEVDGKKVATPNQIKHVVGPKYEGDSVALKYERGGKEVAATLELVGKVKAYPTPYLGILPVRDDPQLGVEIRYVMTKSPADVAGLKAGDRIIKYGTDKLGDFGGKNRGRDELMAFLGRAKPSAEVQFEVVRKDGKKTDVVKLKLADFPGTTPGDKDSVPNMLPPRASAKKALTPLEPGPGQPKPDGPAKKAEPEKGLVKVTAASGNHTYYVYVHGEYDADIAQAVVVWLHPPDKNTVKDLETFAETWDKYCEAHNILLVFPISASSEGWADTDAPKLQEIIRDVLPRYTTDPQRVVAHGLGTGGQMALHLGLTSRDLVHGVAVTAAVPTGVTDNFPGQRVSFFIAAGDRDPLLKPIIAGHEKLAEHKFPSVYFEMKNTGRQYLDAPTLEELVRWIDALDRM